MDIKEPKEKKASIQNTQQQCMMHWVSKIQAQDKKQTNSSVNPWQ